MTIYFQTPDTFDLRGLTVFGAHAKPNSDSPIGHFGTGLKFAIATLARAGCSIRLTDPSTGLDVRVISSSGNFRGTEIGELALQGSINMPLPFTFELGKNWTPLMAYRELVSNVRDEKGTFGPQPKNPHSGFTIEISGFAIEEAYASHDKMFFDNPVVIEDFGNFQVCERHSEPGVFYRGVRVADFGVGKFTYNFLAPVRLTEDRTCDSGTLEYFIAHKLGKTTNERIMKELMHMPKGEEYNAPNEWNKAYPFEWRVQLATIGTPLATAIIERFEQGHPVNPRTLGLAMRVLQKKTQRKTYTPSASQLEMLAEAKRVLEANDIALRHEPKFYISTESAYHGQADMKEDELILHEGAFENGLEHLISVLYEEHLHLTRGLDDNSRAMQTYLLMRLAEAMITIAEPKHN